MFTNKGNEIHGTENKKRKKVERPGVKLPYIHRFYNMILHCSNSLCKSALYMKFRLIHPSYYASGDTRICEQL